MSTLDLDPTLVARARELATRAAQPVVDLAHRHTTVSVERAVLRLAGLTGTDPVTGEGRAQDQVPWVNRVVDAVREQVGLESGVALPVWHALASGTAPSLQSLAEQVGAGTARFALPTGADADRAREAARDAVATGLARIDANRRRREELVATHGDPPRRPWIYLIVATGDIHEDIPQAQAAARAGADVIAVIRSTGQSLLDYVPEGATRTGYAGTYATQENFRLMRAALDDVSAELSRYVRLTNYASGLCMPEIAVLAGLERLDMMLNDAMYGILFRDINPRRTFVDQRFSRMVHARAGIIINTGEDNYLTTAPGHEAGHTVVASNFINRALALAAGIPEGQIGLGHAFEIDPDRPGQLMEEWAIALLIRELFPRCPLKYMPPTKHVTGDIFRTQSVGTLFN
ncbi:MAG TPA: lysine 5,6-aminomutase subunit alpha, partial [Blastococcus sp.]